MSDNHTIPIAMSALIIVAADECRGAATAYSLGFPSQVGIDRQCALEGRRQLNGRKDDQEKADVTGSVHAG